jgi:hypothetical protein
MRYISNLNQKNAKQRGKLHLGISLNTWNAHLKENQNKICDNAKVSQNYIREWILNHRERNNNVKSQQSQSI